jgi:hypothetical protein
MLASGGARPENTCKRQLYRLVTCAAQEHPKEDPAMTIYAAPLEDMRFILNDVLDIKAYANLPGFADASPDVLDAILEESGKFASEVLHPLNGVGDSEGCKRADDGSVTTPKGFKEAYKTFAEGGWTGLSADPDYGGQGLPGLVGLACSEMVSSANMAFGMYPGLAHGAYSALHHHGTDEQKALYLPKMVTGEWTGTMNLTEPHSGTDLGLMRTKAVPQGDGSYKISGSKIWISAGEHDLADNIIHLVLAKIPGGPDGIKGVSLFVVPKFLVNADGSLGERNSLVCGGLEEKMGIHGNSTCVMNYDEATGWLVGEEHKGMRAMFTMMNEARLGVALQGVAIAEVAYQNAADYARERLQGRSISGPKAPDQPADPIIVHPDVRRMLMEQRAFTEGARALLLWAGLHADLANVHPEESVREKGDDYMGLLTPVLKAYFTDMGLRSTVNAQQVYGGSGYTREMGVEQFVRDARITMVYEGANGIQALDLVGRKLAQNGGRALQTFLQDVGGYAKDLKDDDDLGDYARSVIGSVKAIEEATGFLMENALQDPDEAGAASYDFLYLTAYAAMGYIWLQMMQKAAACKSEGAGNPDFHDAKLTTGRFFFERMMPDYHGHLAKLKAGGASMMALDAEAF